MASATVDAAAAGTWTPGDLTGNRVGFGAMRLPQRDAGLIRHLGASNARPEQLAQARPAGHPGYRPPRGERRRRGAAARA
ncbi:hypothetical protein LWP59_23720 [Amycolatopsis acidiphila]|uniref:hypothetical protein n=1 Tax=Amycolatopsis acidiphila TaxID=715473 RepID=UPI0019B9F364|nr:hypothetical protein [Amycolatopsis acidiphila]UIJ57161.1 hypothetical protein LWP59_23720 [Amycolatopsis acidiphila]GHG52977.1 hypothetical protein GCM10017788_01360 [Amycolatopsis acidiphila]